jgi:cyanate lyase-like protein
VYGFDRTSGKECLSLAKACRFGARSQGDRVKITMSGKFLPYKYYGASGNVPEYGFEEG